MRTVEAFFCLRGRFAVKWGDAGENELILEPYDFLPVPPGVVRTFVNVGDSDGELLVIIQGDRTDFDDVEMTPALAGEVEQRFGPEIRAKLEANGRRFTAGIESHSTT